MLNKTIYLAILLIGWPLFLFGQHQLSGNIKDTKGNPLAYAAVHLHETHNGAITKQNGTYKIENIKAGTYHVHVQFTGYHAQTHTLKITKDTIVNFVLDEAVNELHEVLVESDILKTDKKQSSVSIQIINNDKLNENAAASLGESLDKITGLSSVNIGVGVSKPIIRGLGFNRILVAQQGIKQESQQWGSDHGLEIDQFAIDELEIIRGPQSLLYGSDALGGVINIKTPKELPDGHHQAKFQTVYSSVNQKYGGNMQLKGSKGDFSYRISGTYLDFGDYSVPANSFEYATYTLPIINQQLKNTAGEEKDINLNLAYHQNWGYIRLKMANFHQKTGFFSGALGIPRTYQLRDDGDSRNIDIPLQEVNHFITTLQSNILIKKHWLETSLSYQNNLRHELSQPHAHGRPLNLLQDSLAIKLDLSTLTANAKLHLTENHGEHILGASVQYQNNKIAGFEFLIPEYSQWNTGLFWVYNRKWSNKLNTTAGFRADYRSLNAAASFLDFYYRGSYVGEVQRNPDTKKNLFNYALALGANYHFTKHQYIRANLGKTFRYPAITELLSNGVHHGTVRFEKGNPNLNTEEALQLDLGWIIDEEKWAIEINAYGNYFFNYIYLQPSGKFARLTYEGNIYPFPEPGQVYEYRQDPVLHLGAESEITANLKWVAPTIQLQYTYFKNLNTQLGVPFTPPGKAALNLKVIPFANHKQLKNLYLNFDSEYHLEQKRTVQNEWQTPAYFLQHVNVGFNGGKRNELRFQLGVNNIWNTSYLKHLSRYRILGIPEPGRYYTVRLTYTLNYLKKEH